MRRPALRVSLALLLVVGGAGCQDYNFNPVGKCLIQPATERVTLSDISAADVLFVVDDSGSMRGEQQKLAANFQSFIQNLNTFNNARVANLTEPFDFHIAVTTTSVSWNPALNATCRTDCGAAAGSPVCCGNTSGAPEVQPKRCAVNGDCGATETCKSTCNGNKGTLTCCDAGGVPRSTQHVACETVGAACGAFEQHYSFQGTCEPGVGADQWPFPAGDFVSWSDATHVNPRVLHFDKELYGATGKNRQGFTQTQLEQFFAGGGAVQGNVVVGTCGSGQEQALMAGRRAVEKALAGQQRDTVDPFGATTWDATTRVAGSPAEWPHPGAKLVVVFVGDEDDCSFQIAGNAGPTGVVWLPEPAGADACVRDATLPEAQRRELKVADFVDYLTGLGRPLGAAFVVSTAQDACGREGLPVCTAGFCTDSTCTEAPSVCGGQAPGFRLVEAAQGLQSQDADVVSGSICDGDFAAILDEIANVVRPPGGLVLPTEPAESVVTLLRIADREGQTRKLCTGPAPVGTAAADLGAWDWWFTTTRDPSKVPSAVSRFVYINHDTGRCEANPGETYSADYIGLLPAGGCQSRDQCRNTLGGRLEDWGCYKPPGASRGTCICCAAGSTDPACTSP
jgi:hypothetical protein